MLEIVFMGCAFIVIATVVLGVLSIVFTPLVMFIYSLAVGAKDDARGFAILSFILYTPIILVAFFPN